MKRHDFSIKVINVDRLEKKSVNITSDGVTYKSKIIKIEGLKFSPHTAYSIVTGMNGP